MEIIKNKETLVLKGKIVYDFNGVFGTCTCKISGVLWLREGIEGEEEKREIGFPDSL